MSVVFLSRADDGVNGLILIPIMLFDVPLRSVVSGLWTILIVAVECNGVRLTRFRLLVVAVGTLPMHRCRLCILKAVCVLRLWTESRALRVKP